MASRRSPAGPTWWRSSRKAGFQATKKFDDPESRRYPGRRPGRKHLVLRVRRSRNHHPALVQFLQGTDFTGVIFSRLPIDGTFPLEQVGISTTNGAPDVLVSMRWSRDKNEHGAPGFSSEGGKRQGSHASLGLSDMRNTLVAAGPDLSVGSQRIPLRQRRPSADHPAYSRRAAGPRLAHGWPSASRSAGRQRHAFRPPVTKTMEASRQSGLLPGDSTLKFSEYDGTDLFR